MFLTKYVSLDIYDEDVKKIFIIDHEELQLDKNYVWNLIEIPDELNGSMFYHEYSCIHEDIFGRIQSYHQEKNISLNIISNEPNENGSKRYATEICFAKICKNKSTFVNNKPRHTLHR